MHWDNLGSMYGSTIGLPLEDGEVRVLPSSASSSSFSGRIRGRYRDEGSGIWGCFDTWLHTMILRSMGHLDLYIDVSNSL